MGARTAQQDRSDIAIDDDLDFDSELSEEPIHVTREMEMRERFRRDQNWMKSGSLPQPNPIDGMEFRYVRCMYRGTSDTPNVSEARRQGWEPCSMVDHSELFCVADPHSLYPGMVEFGNLLLHKRPTWMGEELAKVADQEMQAQMDGIEQNYFRERAPGVHQVRFGNG